MIRQNLANRCTCVVIFSLNSPEEFKQSVAGLLCFSPLNSWLEVKTRTTVQVRAIIKNILRKIFFGHHRWGIALGAIIIVVLFKPAKVQTQKDKFFPIKLNGTKEDWRNPRIVHKIRQKFLFQAWRKIQIGGLKFYCSYFTQSQS